MSFNCDSRHLGNPHHLSLTSHRSGEHFCPSFGYSVFILEVLPVFFCNFLQIWTAFLSLYWISTEMLSSSWKFYLYFSVISYIRGQRFRPSIGNLRKYFLHLYLSVFVCNFLQIWTMDIISVPPLHWKSTEMLSSLRKLPLFVCNFLQQIQTAAFPSLYSPVEYMRRHQGPNNYSGPWACPLSNA